MEEVLKFLKESPVFYLATNDSDQPRVRPFGAVTIFEGKLYIISNNKKKVFDQIKRNPKVEICGMGQDGSWLRVEAKALQDNRLEAREAMLEDYQGLKSMYKADDGIVEVLYLTDATATFYKFGGEPREIKF